MQEFYSNGKLLITGEYLVLDGALSLALPTKFGQSLHVETINENKIIWESFDENKNLWFNDVYTINELAARFSTPKNDVSKRIIQILNTAKTLNPHIFNTKSGAKISTHLNFPRNWGLGTSSTLINNVAQWLDLDAFELLEKTFGGSGYDIACAQNSFTLTYQLQKNRPHINKVNFNPSFKEHLYFVYLNQKQNSRDGIANYKLNKGNINTTISEINDITTKIIQSTSLSNFETLIAQHESIISKIIKIKPVKDLLFNDFNGAIKSLGAWGGDFILVSSNNDPSTYFNNKGYQTIIPYSNMVL